MIWRDEVLDQLEFYWDNHLAPRLVGLTDDEYFWERSPAVGRSGPRVAGPTA